MQSLPASSAMDALQHGQWVTFSTNGQTRTGILAYNDHTLHEDGGSTSEVLYQGKALTWWQPSASAWLASAGFQSSLPLARRGLRLCTHGDLHRPAAPRRTEQSPVNLGATADQQPGACLNDLDEQSAQLASHKSSMRALSPLDEMHPAESNQAIHACTPVRCVQGCMLS